MDGFIVFFRNILSGPLYIAVVVIAIVLIFACIGYLAEKGLNEKKIASQYVEADSVVIDHPTGPSAVVDTYVPLEETQSVSDVGTSNLVEEAPSVTEVMPVVDPSMNMADTYFSADSNVAQVSSGVSEIPEITSNISSVAEVSPLDASSVAFPTPSVVDVPTSMSVSNVVSPDVLPAVDSNVVTGIPEVMPSVSMPAVSIPTVNVDSSNL